MLMNLFVRFEAVRTLLSFALQLAALLFVPAIGSGSVLPILLMSTPWQAGEAKR